MELRDWALRVFTADTLQEKLLRPPDGLKSLSDAKPGEAMAWTRPPRPAHLQIAPKKKRKRIPSPKSLDRKDMRIRTLHAFANHELMALELMAWALLAFPDAPDKFRKGLAKVLLDEQEHFELYSRRLEAMGAKFGDVPVNDHFWRAAASISDPLDWVCTMHLTFEQANLDHAPYFGRLFEQVGDHESAALMETIFRDEIRHVRFGSKWLKELKADDQSLFQAYSSHCTPHNGPFRAKGPGFQEEARKQAGLDDDFIATLLAVQSDE